MKLRRDASATAAPAGNPHPPPLRFARARPRHLGPIPAATIKPDGGGVGGGRWGGGGQRTPFDHNSIDSID